MSVICDVIDELWNMFVADWRMSMALLLVVGLAWVFVQIALTNTILVGGILLFGVLGVLTLGVMLAARSSIER